MLSLAGVSFRGDHDFNFDCGRRNSITTDVMSADRDLQRQIVEVLNEEIGSDLKHLFRLKQLYEETKALQNNLKEKVQPIILVIVGSS